MKHFCSPFRSSALVAAALFALAATVPTAHAIEKAQIGKIAFDDIPSPEIASGKSKTFKPKDWLEVEAELNIPGQTPEQKKIGFLDQITVKWYVAVKNREGKGFLLLTKDITHINVPVAEAIYSSVYLSPSTVKRLTGQDRAGKSAVDLVGVEVLVNGVKVGEATNKGKEGWWNSTSENLARSDKFPLLTKDETPFNALWFDRYAEIQKEK